MAFILLYWQNNMCASGLTIFFRKIQQILAYLYNFDAGGQIAPIRDMGSASLAPTKPRHSGRMASVVQALAPLL
jgi:hypothetical protein